MARWKKDVAQLQAQPPSMSARAEPRQVIVVDPFHVMRTGLEMLIEATPGFEVAGSAATTDDGLRVVRSLQRPTGTIILVGLHISGPKDAFSLIRTLREEFPTTIVIALGSNADKMAISRALFVGADGFVDKTSQAEEFFDVLTRCATGEVVVGGASGESLGEIVAAIDLQKEAQPLLTDREREVLQIASEGLTAREIGERLGLRERTVTTHLGRIYGKLGVSTRVAAIATATRSGLVSVSSSE